jgi:hypothetical protein
MSKTIDTLLSPLHADDKLKGAIISLSLLIIFADKSIGNEETDTLDFILKEHTFKEKKDFPQFVASAKIISIEALKSEKEQDKFILDCVKNLHEKVNKAEVLYLIKNISLANKIVSPAENIIIEKIHKCINTI